MSVWIDPQPVRVPEDVRRLLPGAGDLDLLVGELLVRRGVADVETARGFLDPAAYAPAPPEALPDVTEAVGRLTHALERGEQVVVWGDFDVDGLTATALYLQALRELGAQASFHIPTRRESHGVHVAGVQRLIDQGMRLLLTADTGIAAHSAIALAAAHGVDVLVTDHHDLPSDPPPALALVNPKRLAPQHPLYELSGVGVAYQLVCALYGRAGRPEPTHLLDLVALGMVADVATLRADVRYLVQRGLAVLRQAGRLGLRAVMDLADLEAPRVTEEDISFALAPRLNAISRVGAAHLHFEGELDTGTGVELLTTGDLTRARTIAVALEALNARRRWLTRQTVEGALAQLDRDPALLGGPAIVVAGPDWDPGIVGIVAGWLAERLRKPAIVISAPPGEMARGSARSIEGVDIHAAIAAQQPLLYRCGGHPMAAGLSLEADRIPEFRQALWRTLDKTAPPPAEREVGIEAYLTLDQLSLDLVRAVNRLSPFGPGNEQPVFATRQLELASSAVIGRTREHRRLVVRDAQQREQTILWWRGADQTLPEGAFDLAYTIGANAFRGQESVQLTWVDARAIAPPVVEVTAMPRIAVRDHRGLQDPMPLLRSLALPRREDTLVWGEGVSLDAIPLCDRDELHHADTLIVWTAPPGPDEFQAALERVSPAQVVLFAIDPGLDAPREFLYRLAGLIKYVLRERGGRVALAMLASKMAHREWTVRLGLDWMAAKGQIAYRLQDGDVVVAGRERGRQEEGERLEILQGRLQVWLEETAAYRAYFRHAGAGGLVGA